MLKLQGPGRGAPHVARVPVTGCLLKLAALRAAYGRMRSDPPPSLLCFQNLAGTQLWGWETENLMAGPEGGGTPTHKPSFLPFPDTEEAEFEVGHEGREQGEPFPEKSPG